MSVIYQRLISGITALWLGNILICVMAISSPSQAANQENVLAVGDRVKLIVLETSAEADSSNLADALFVERAELTGEYTVQEGGMIDVPILGQAPAAEQTITKVKKFLHTKYRQVFGREPTVSLTLIAREPVYIVGPVTRPGSYDFSPNLTVLHLIARAGGPNNPAFTNWEMLETIRERHKLQVSMNRQQKLLALIAVLEIEGTDRVLNVPSQLRILAGSNAESLLAEAREVRSKIVEVRDLKLQALDESISTTRKMLENKNERVRFMAENVDSRQQRMLSLKSLADRGGINSFNFNQAKSDWSDANDRLQDALGTRSQVEERALQLQLERKNILLSARIEIERELMNARDKLMEEERTAAASAQIANLSPEFAKLRDISSTDVFYTIQRKADGKSITFDASDETPLRPGDLVIVRKVRDEVMSKVDREIISAPLGSPSN